jgi:N-acetylmuramoyl-L-alanine amidase
MYKTVEEKPIQKTTVEKLMNKRPSWPILVLIPTILLILLLGAIMGAIAGFISTPEMLEDGVVKLKAIDDGATQITELKKNEQTMVETKSKEVDSEEKKKNTEIDIVESGKINQEIIFKVQVLSSGKPLASNSPQFKGQKNVWEYEDGGLYKYTVGNKRDLQSASALQLELREKGFSDAFVVAFQNEKRIPMRKALKLLK